MFNVAEPAAGQRPPRRRPEPGPPRGGKTWVPSLVWTCRPALPHGRDGFLAGRVPDGVVDARVGNRPLCAEAESDA